VKDALLLNSSVATLSVLKRRWNVDSRRVEAVTVRESSKILGYTEPDLASGMREQLVVFSPPFEQLEEVGIDYGIENTQCFGPEPYGLGTQH
jgi:hypothetical protein